MILKQRDRSRVSYPGLFNLRERSSVSVLSNASCQIVDQKKLHSPRFPKYFMGKQHSNKDASTDVNFLAYNTQNIATSYIVPPLNNSKIFFWNFCQSPKTKAGDEKIWDFIRNLGATQVSSPEKLIGEEEDYLLVILYHGGPNDNTIYTGAPPEQGNPIATWKDKELTIRSLAELIGNTKRRVGILAACCYGADGEQARNYPDVLVHYHSCGFSVITADDETEFPAIIPWLKKYFQSRSH